MSTYASMCTLPLEKAVYKDAYDLFILATDTENQVYLRQLRTCFSSELARLGNLNCSALIRQQSGIVLNDLVSSLVDVETLMMFPTSNIKLVIAEGGNDLRREMESMLTTSRRVNQSSRSPDEEAMLIMGSQNEFLDTVGPNYTSQHLWSHCNRVATLLSQNQMRNPYEQREKEASDYSAVAKVLRDKCSELLCSEDLLENLPAISLERECFKRMIVIRALLKVDVAGHKLLCSTVMHCILENMYHLSEVALHYEKQRVIGCSDKSSRLARGKAVALQKAYLTFSGSLLSCLLRDNLSMSTDQSAFIREVILRVLKKDGIRSVIEDAHKKPFLQFHLRKKAATLTESEKDFFKNMSSDLASTFLCRADDLLVHDVGYNSKGFLHSMLTTPHLADIGLKESFAVIANQLLLKPVSAMIHSPRWKSDLQMAINHHIHHTETCISDSSRVSSLPIVYRESVLSPFLSEKLNDKSPALRKASLQLLTSLLKTFSSNDIRPEEKVYNSEGNLASFMTYARVARSLKLCLESNVDSTDDLKACANALLSVPVSTGDGGKRPTLLNHATSSSTTNQKQLEIKYIAEFSKWLHNSGNASGLESLTSIERELFTEVKTMQKKQNVNNPYAK